MKDFVEEIKSKEILISIISYSTLVLVVVATTSYINNSIEIFSTIFWISLSFSVILGINKSMSKEFENNGLEMLLTSPIGFEIVIMSKAITNFILISISSAIILLFNNIILNYDLYDLEFIFLVLIVNFGFSIIGTITYLLFSKARGKEILSPLLFIPLVSPLLMGGSLTSVQIMNNNLEGYAWYGLIIAYDIIFLLIGVFISNLIFQE
ncbi:MAG: heme exporter protein CcmB [Dehalococcoidia bacterium]|tara:strand:+ start:61 stop:687 length:627 start_codon:yes stop_codon:yes gene_type:complete